MKEGYIIKYFNEYCRFDEEHDFLRIRNISETNEVHLIWWDNSEFRHDETIGVWKIKSLKQ